MCMGFAPTWLRQVSPLPYMTTFNYCLYPWYIQLLWVEEITHWGQLYFTFALSVTSNSTTIAVNKLD